MKQEIFDISTKEGKKQVKGYKAIIKGIPCFIHKHDIWSDCYVCSELSTGIAISKPKMESNYKGIPCERFCFLIKDARLCAELNLDRIGKSKVLDTLEKIRKLENIGYLNGTKAV